MDEHLPRKSVSDFERFDTLAKLGFATYLAVALVGVLMGHYPSLYEIVILLMALAFYGAVRGRGRLPEAPHVPNFFQIPGFRRRKREKGEER